MSESPHPNRTLKLFFSYAREDGALRDELEKHLSNLKWENVIATWHDSKIVPGDEWAAEINKALEEAELVLLLISADFMDSPFIRRVELKRAMERHEAGEAIVIPVILRPVDWSGAPFSKLQALPTDAKPVTSWPNRDEAYLSIAKGIKKAIEELLERDDKRPKLPSIPRPPSFGFVARRDPAGRFILERLKEELAPGQNRLITLTGAGGVGKTTLAAEAARALKKTYEGRIVWTSAEARPDFSLPTLLDDIAAQLGQPDLRTLAPDRKEEHLLALVSDASALIVLDNCETIALPEQARIQQWFARADCSALFTSRHRIGDTFHLPIAAMSREESADFLERLITQTQDPQIFSADVRQSIYETAEANPYVMQWVVAQIDDAQEPRIVLEELQHGGGDAAERVFHRSFNLPQLGDDGRAALLALSLFAPSASRTALAAVAGFGDDLNRVNEAVKNLHSLWLIKGLDANSRFTTEGLTRTLAGARLSKLESADDFRQRFVAYFLTYAEAHAQPTPEDYDALEAEKDNLLDAIDTAFDLEDWESVQIIAYIITEPESGMLSVRGYWDEAIQRGEQAILAAQAANDEGRVAMFSGNIAVIRMNRGEYDAAQRAYEHALDAFKKLGSDTNVAAALHNLGMITQKQGDIEEARRLYYESLEIEKKLGNQSGIVSTLYELGRLAQAQRDIEEARRLYNESLEIARKLSNQSGIAIILHQLGMIAQAQGDIEEARRLYYGSLEITRKLGNQSGIASTLHQLGVIAEKEGNRDEAARLMREALGIFERLRSPDAETARRNLERLEKDSS